MAGSAGDVHAIEGLTPRAVVDATLARLGRLPPDARSVAEAVALLEPVAELRWIAALTGLDVEAVAVAADSLLALGLLRSVAPCRFEHPILRSAVESEISPARRGRLHLSAARSLAAADMPVDAVAAHLMQTPPLGEPWIASALAAGGGAGQRPRRARRRGRVSAARAGRAPDAARAPSVARGPRQSRKPDPARRRRRATCARRSHSPRAPTRSRRWPSGWDRRCITPGRWTRPTRRSATSSIAAAGRGGDAMLELEAYLLSIASLAGTMPETARRAASLEARTPPDSPIAGAVQATLAFREAFGGVPRQRVRERVQRALVDIQRGSAPSSHLADRQAPGMTLIWIDDLDRAIELFTELLTGAARMGMMQTFEIFSALRAYTLQRRGDLADAAADIEPIITAAARTGSLGFSAVQRAHRPRAAAHRRRSGRSRRSAGARSNPSGRASSAGSRPPSCAMPKAPPSSLRASSTRRRRR